MTTTITTCWSEGYEAGKAGIEVGDGWMQRCTDWKEGYSAGCIVASRLSEVEFLDEALAAYRAAPVVYLTDAQLAEIENARPGEDEVSYVR